MSLYDLDEALGLHNIDNSQAAAANLADSFGRNPDEEAQKRQLQKSTGVPATLMDDPSIKADAQKQNFMQGIKIGNSPATAKLASDPNKAPVISDSIQDLKDMELTAADALTGAVPAWSSVMEQYGIKPFQRLQGSLGKLVTKLTFPIASTADWFRGDDYYKEFASQLYEKYAEIQKEGRPEEGQNFAGKIVSAVQDLVPLVLSGGSGIAGIVGTSINEKYDELRAQGLSHDAAIAVALKSGMTSYAMTKIPFGGRNLTNSLVRGAAFNPAAGVMDRAAERSMLSYMDYGEQAGHVKLFDSDSAIHEAVMGMMFGAQHSIMSGRPVKGESLMESVVPFYDTYQAGRRANALLELGKAVQASKLDQRDPELMQEHLENIGKQNGVENVFIPVEAWDLLYQSKGFDPAKVAEKVMSDPSSYYEAKSTGGNVVVPFKEYIDNLSKVDGYDEIVKDTTLALGDTSLREAAAAAAREAEDTKGGGGIIAKMRKMADEVRTDQGLKESAQKIHDDLMAQQEAAGVPRGVAKYNADLHARTFLTLARRWNEANPDNLIAPYETFKEYGLQVKGVGETAETGVEPAINDLAAQTLKTVYQMPKEDVKRGYLNISNRKNMEIGLLKNADLSTFLHESGHFFTEVLGDLSERENAPAQIKADFASLLKFAGVESRTGIKTEHHEKLADAFEKYLMEGKAPSVEVHGLFQRMKAWMISVYKDLSNIHVRLNDEVRGVFDRLLASDEEIERLRSMDDMRPIFATAKEAGMSQKEFDLYRAAMAKASETAKETLLARMLQDKQREQKSWWKAEEEKTREEVTAEAQADPVYQAYHLLTTGKAFDGREIGEVKISREALVDMYGEEAVKALPRGMQRVYSAKGGVHPDLLAERLGFSSGDELIQKLKDKPKMKDWIKSETDRRMQERHGNILLDGSLHEEAIKAAYNDEQGQVLRAELQALNRMRTENKPLRDQAKVDIKEKDDEIGQKNALIDSIIRKDKEQRREMVKSIPPLEYFKRVAREAMGNKRVADVEPHIYSLASRKAARECFQAVGKGDYETAAQAKVRELLSHYLYKEAMAARDFADKAQAYGQKMATAKELGKLGKAGDEFLVQIQSILERYDFAKITNKALAARQESLEQFLSRLRDQENLDLPIPPDIVDETQRPVSYKELSVDHLRAVYDSMKMIEHAARQVNTVKAAERRVAVAQAATSLDTSLTESIQGDGAKVPKRVSDDARSFSDRVKDVNIDIAVLLPEFIFERFDGLKKTGAWHDHFWNRYNDAADHLNRLREMVFPKIMEYARGSNIDRSRKFYIKSLDATLSKDDIMAIALNCGNESNLDKLMRGGIRFKSDEAAIPLDEAKLQEILSHLTPKEIEVVNGIWQTINMLKPEAAALAKRRTGIEPAWIEAKPMDVANGRLEGGYYPLKYDPRFSRTGEKQADTSTLDQMFTRYASATTRQGYLKERSKFAAPLSLDWQAVVSRHLDEVCTDISHWEFATDAQRLLKNGTVKESIIRNMGDAYYKNLLDWVRYTVNQDNMGREASDNLEQLRRNIRGKMSTYVLGFKVANAIAEMGIGVPLALQHVAPVPLFKGVMTYLRNPLAAHRFAVEASDYMKRMDTEVDRNITEALNDLAGRHSLMDDIRRWSIASRMFFWKIGATMAWHGGYEDAMSQGLQGKDAVRIADSIYRMTQESGRPGDLSAVQRNPNMKELTMFIGPTLIQYNNNARAVRAFKDQGLTAQTLKLGMITLLAGHAANTILFDLMRGKTPDDNEKIPAWLLCRLTLGLFDGIPIARDVAAYAEGRIQGEQGKDIRAIPVLQAGKDTIDALLKTAKAYEGDTEWSKAILAIAKASGAWTGLPMLQASITGQYVNDQLSGDYYPEHSWSPATDIMYARHKK